MNSLRLLVPDIAATLIAKNLTIATAESCTGGGLGYWLTSIPGSSAWFDRGFTTYTNAAKMEMLGVKAATLEQYGAVSRETALEMADGARAHSQAKLSIAITGIAGPAGGTPDKPVGTVWIAWSSTTFPTTAQAFLFTGDRQAIRLAAMAKALEELLILLK